MDKFFKISDAALIALHAVVYLAKNSQRRVRALEIADFFMISEAHLSKVLQRLTKAGYVKPYRGPQGGYKLIADPKEISLFEIYELIEGAVSPAVCLVGSRRCPGNDCLMGTINGDVYNLITKYLKNCKITELKEKLFEV